MNHFLGHPGFALLSGLGLPGADFAVAGSGPLFARGWLSDIGDVDVIARGPAWNRVCELGPVEAAPFAKVDRLLLFAGRIDVLNGWFPEFWNIDQLIDEADVIDGMRFMKLTVVAETKKMLQRPQDETHLQILRDHGITV